MDRSIKGYIFLTKEITIIATTANNSNNEIITTTTTTTTTTTIIIIIMMMMMMMIIRRRRRRRRRRDKIKKKINVQHKNGLMLFVSVKECFIKDKKTQLYLERDPPLARSRIVNICALKFNCFHM